MDSQRLRDWTATKALAQNDKCLVCDVVLAPSEQCRHYTTLGSQRIADLVVVCARCQKLLSGSGLGDATREKGRQLLEIKYGAASLATAAAAALPTWEELEAQAAAQELASKQQPPPVSKIDELLERYMPKK